MILSWLIFLLDEADAEPGVSFPSTQPLFALEDESNSGSPADIAHGSINAGQERTFIDITAIPRLQSGHLFALVYTYVSLVDCLRSMFVVVQGGRADSVRLQYLCRNLHPLGNKALSSTAT